VDDHSNGDSVISDADRLREHLAALGISQREAARQLGVDDRAMRYYCAGKLPVPAAIMHSLPQLQPARAPSSLVIPPSLEAAYQAADQRREPLDEINLAGRFDEVLKDLGHPLQANERRGAFAVVQALYFSGRRSYGAPVYDMYWQPLSTWVDDKGAHHHQPDVVTVDDEIIYEWSERAQASEHPVLRARYADLAWEIAKFRAAAVRAAPPDVMNARTAVDAYLNVVRGDLARDNFAAWLSLARAAELAATIRDATRLSQVKEVLFSYQAACGAGDASYPFWLFDNIAWEQRRALALTAEEQDRVITALQRVLSERSDPTVESHFDPHSARDAADRIARWQRQRGDQAAAAEASAAGGKTIEAAADRSGALTAIALLGDQAVRYRNAGDTESLTRVEQTIRRRAPDAKAELKRIEVPIDVPKDQLDIWADNVAGASFDEGIRNVLAANLVRKGQTQADLLAMAPQAPLSASITLNIMRDDGFTSAVIGPVEDDLDGRTVHHGARTIGFAAPFLAVSLRRFLEKHDVDLERLVAWLSESPFMPQSRLTLVRHGLRAWFARDWISSVHVLVPQIEASLRDLLAAMGGIVMKISRKEGRFGDSFQAISLGAVLNHDLFRSQVPEDIRFHLEVLLQDERGINLRPETMHGLASAELFQMGIANWVVHALLLVGLVRVHRGESAGRERES
jgi:hypothetical protein